MRCWRCWSISTHIWKIPYTQYLKYEVLEMLVNINSYMEANLYSIPEVWGVGDVGQYQLIYGRYLILNTWSMRCWRCWSISTHIWKIPYTQYLKYEVLEMLVNINSYMEDTLFSIPEVWGVGDVGQYQLIYGRYLTLNTWSMRCWRCWSISTHIWKIPYTQYLKYEVLEMLVNINSYMIIGHLLFIISDKVHVNNK